VADEEPLPAHSAVVAADSGNGLSSEVDFASFGFVNSGSLGLPPRDPVDKWIGMHTRSLVEPTGAGLATTVLHDLHGAVGRGNQTLLITAY